MKEKLLTILLSVCMVLSIFTVRVFADDPKTIGDIVNGVLPLVCGDKTNLPTNVWTNSNTFKCFIFNDSLSIEKTADSLTTGFSIPLSNSITKNENHFAYSFEGTTIDFYFENNNLISIEVSSSISEYKDLIGIYIAPHIHTEGSDTITFNPWDGGAGHNTMPSTAGNYVLTSDITLSNNWLIENISNPINLCLNGHVIKTNGGNFIPIHIKNSTLNLYDCDNTTIHYFNEQSSGLWTLAENQAKPTDYYVTGGYITGAITPCGTINVEGNGTLNMYGGNIVGNKASNSSNNGNGGGIYLVGTLNMYGGSIVGNITTDSSGGKGGGIYLGSGAINMYGGIIASNHATDGGGVYVSGGKFNMYGGTISDNDAQNCGGGVNVQSTFNMTKGTIEYNRANPNNDCWGGGGIVFYGSNANGNLSGGKVQYNSSTVNGGGILFLEANKTGSVSFDDASIVNNTAKKGGGGVYLDNSSVEVVFAKNTNINGNVLNGEITKTDSGYSLSNGTTNNLELGRENSNLNINSSSSESMNIGLFSSNIKIKKATIDDIKYFFADNENYKVGFDNNDTDDVTTDDFIKLENITILDILSTAIEDFPTSSEKGWVNANGKRVYIVEDATISLKTNEMLNDPVEKVGDNYKFVSSDSSYTFVMTSGKLTSIIASGTSEPEFNGEYVPYKYTNDPYSKPSGYAGDLEFVTNASFTNDYDVTVKVDDNTLTLNKHYTLAHASTHVTLKGSYVSTLSAGTHKITVEVDGYVPISQDFTITAAPSPTPKPAYKAPKTAVE